MSAPRAANLPPERYAPDTPFDFIITFLIADYDLTGKEAVFEIEKNGVVTYRFSSEDGGDIDITGQVITGIILPTTLSPDFPAVRFRDAIGELDEVQYRIDTKVIGSAVTDFRFQGLLNILESHGTYTAKT